MLFVHNRIPRSKAAAFDLTVFKRITAGPEHPLNFPVLLVLIHIRKAAFVCFELGRLFMNVLLGLPEQRLLRLIA